MKDIETDTHTIYRITKQMKQNNEDFWQTMYSG